LKAFSFNSSSYFIYRWFSIGFNFPVWASSKQAGGISSTLLDQNIMVMEGMVPPTERILIVCFKVSYFKELCVVWWNTFKTFGFIRKFFVFRYILFQIKIIQGFFLHGCQLCVILLNIKENEQSLGHFIPHRTFLTSVMFW